MKKNSWVKKLLIGFFVLLFLFMAVAPLLATRYYTDPAAPTGLNSNPIEVQTK